MNFIGFHKYFFEALFFHKNNHRNTVESFTFYVENVLILKQQSISRIE